MRSPIGFRAGIHTRSNKTSNRHNVGDNNDCLANVLAKYLSAASLNSIVEDL